MIAKFFFTLIGTIMISFSTFILIDPDYMILTSLTLILHTSMVLAITELWRK